MKKFLFLLLCLGTMTAKAQRPPKPTPDITFSANTIKMSGDQTNTVRFTNTSGKTITVSSIVTAPNGLSIVDSGLPSSFPMAPNETKTIRIKWVGGTETSGRVVVSCNGAGHSVTVVR